MLTNITMAHPEIIIVDTLAHTRLVIAQPSNSTFTGVLATCRHKDQHKTIDTIMVSCFILASHMYREFGIFIIVVFIIIMDYIALYYSVMTRSDKR